MKISKLKSYFLLCIILICFNVIQVSAADYFTMNDHTLNGGVGNYGYSRRYYFIDSSASSSSYAIHQAMSEWVDTQTITSLSFRETSDQPSSVIDIYSTSDQSSSSNGWTEFFSWGTQIDPASENWGWNKIFINTYYYNNLEDYEQKGVLAHEMGHCFGLNENNTNHNSIMAQSIYGRYVYRAQECDLNGINYLYH